MFKVPIIPPDLRHEETITQAAFALDCLQNTIATIFGSIDKRIEKNNVKIKELQERINNSKAKINSLQGTRKAIHIYAPARFPATNIFKDLPVTFNKDGQSKLKPFAKYQIKTKLDSNLPSLNEKLIFFHVRDQNSVKLTPDSSLIRDRCKIKQNQDLGSMPSDLRSIPSVLLFNTDFSVYGWDEGDSETQGHSDTWKRGKLFKNRPQHHGNYQTSSAKQMLGPAPHSMVYRRNEKLTPSGGLKYTPKLSEAPELDLPLDLPDLPGIADDLRYESQEAKQKIAPSLALVVENLPELTELMKDNYEKTHIPIKETVSNNSTPPPPPPPPLPVVQSSVPQPPPPPPPVIQYQSTQRETNATNKPKTVSPISTDSRSELMAAIRNAGGIGKAGLRQTAAAPLASNDNGNINKTRPQNTPSKVIRSQGGGDLMADLHTKLLMRRKGISGSKENSDISNIRNSNNSTAPTNIPSGNPVISRLSALIPPPPPITKQTSRNTATTSEEDDEDDSNDTDWVD